MSASRSHERRRRRNRPARSCVDRRGRRGRATRRARPPSTSAARRTSPRSACRSSTSRATTSSTGRSASPTSSRTHPARSAPTAARSCTARRRRATRPGSSAPPGSSARSGTTSCGRCCGSAAEREEVAVGGRPARLPDVHGAPGGSGTAGCAAPVRHLPRRGRRGVHVGPSSQRRSSRRPGSTAGCGGSRQPNSARARRDPRTRCCGASGARPSCRTGATACARVSGGCL